MHKGWTDSNKSAKKGKQSKKAHRVCKDVLFVFVPGVCQGVCVCVNIL